MVGSRADKPSFADGNPNFQQPGSQWALAGNERRAPGGAGLLAVVVGEDRTFVGDAIDIGRAVAHHAAVVSTDVPITDVVTHDREDVWLVFLCRHRTDQQRQARKRAQETQFEGRLSMGCPSLDPSRLSSTCPAIRIACGGRHGQHSMTNAAGK